MNNSPGVPISIGRSYIIRHLNHEKLCGYGHCICCKKRENFAQVSHVRSTRSSGKWKMQVWGKEFIWEVMGWEVGSFENAAKERSRAFIAIRLDFEFCIGRTLLWLQFDDAELGRKFWCRFLEGCTPNFGKRRKVLFLDNSLISERAWRGL
jgi:hypothetical protein